MDWPQAVYPGGVIEVGHEEARRLLEEVPADKRVYTIEEFLEMINSWGRPIEDSVEAVEVHDYIEHMAAGGYVIGRPA